MSSLSCLLPISSPYSRSRNQACSPQNRRHETNYCVPCRASNNNGDQNPMNSKPREGKISLNMFDRRDVLFGLGGLYGAATLGGNRPALADPQIPDVTNCQPATIVDGVTVGCCPKPPFHEDTISDFVPPPATGKFRVRPAAHLVTEDQLTKFEKAISIMKSLDKHDPRNFYQQADVHCAYCNYAYKQKKYPKADFEVHWNALFFPFHRCYLYFFERICGYLIRDPDFAIPFWNWDSEPGMYFPQIYNNPNSSIYDKIRDRRHTSGKLLDLNYDGATEDPPYDVADCNIRWMHKQMMVDGKTTHRFLGHLLRGGDEAGRKGQGTIERSPHNNVHDWVGNPNSKYGEDMGNFYSAGRDPVFYAHHGNVDRMWSIWRGLTEVPRDYNDCDWMDSSFIFYDELGKAVRIKVEQCLKTEDLGYVYQDVEIPWLYSKQIPRRRALATQSKQPAPPPAVRFPQNLDTQINTSVERIPRSGELTDEDEVLVIEGIEFDATSKVHFNVLINVLDEGKDVCPGNLEFAGNFNNIPHGHSHRVKTDLNLVITGAIEELGLVENRILAVRLDPKVGGDKVTIGGIKIELQPVN